MGNAVSHAVKQVDGGDEARREAEDVLNRLVVLSEVKAANHYHKVLHDPIHKDLLPIDKVVRRQHVTHCCVKTDSEAVRQATEEYLGPYVKAEILAGLTAVIFESLRKLMESTSIKSSSEIASYAITLGKNGDIGRIDCYMFYYEFQAPHLKNVLRNCLITSLVLSKANVSKSTTTQLKDLARAPYSARLPGESEERAGERLSLLEDLIVHEFTQGWRKKSGPV